MKLFSTRKRVNPRMLKIKISPYNTRILPLRASVKNANALVRLSRSSDESAVSSSFKLLMTDGKRVNATINAVATPIIIIQPKVIIGSMPLTISEPNATAVVSAV